SSSKEAMTTGGELTINATVSPSNTTDSYTVSWKSGDTSVATVSGGKVKAVAAGTAVITASVTNSESETFTATCEVTVADKVVYPTSITLSDAMGSNPADVGVNINNGDNTTLRATLSRTDSEEISESANVVNWSVADTTIASIDKNSTVSDGELVISGLKAGSTTLTVSYTTEEGTQTIEIPVTVVSTEVTRISVSERPEINDDNVYVLNAVIAPEAAANQTITWTFSESSTTTTETTALLPCTKNGTVITGDVTGTTIYVKRGSLTKETVVHITATAPNGIQGKTYAKVYPVSVTGLTLGSSTMALDLTTDVNGKSLAATITPSNAGNKTVNWSVANENVATISPTSTQSGKSIVITPVGVGTTTVTATSDADSSISAECTITVTKTIITEELNVSYNDGTDDVDLVDGDTVTIDEGESVDFAASVNEGSTEGITWEVEDSTIGTLSSTSGTSSTFTSLKGGKTTVTITSGSISKTINLVVNALEEAYVKSIEFTDSVTSVDLTGKTSASANLSASVTMSDGSDYTGSITWSTSNNLGSISSGKLTAVDTGIITVTATAGEKQVSKNIAIYKLKATISNTGSTLKPCQYTSFTATLSLDVGGSETQAETEGLIDDSVTATSNVGFTKESSYISIEDSTNTCKVTASNTSYSSSTSEVYVYAKSDSNKTTLATYTVTHSAYSSGDINLSYSPSTVSVDSGKSTTVTATVTTTLSNMDLSKFRFKTVTVTSADTTVLTASYKDNYNGSYTITLTGKTVTAATTVKVSVAAKYPTSTSGTSTVTANSFNATVKVSSDEKTYVDDLSGYTVNMTNSYYSYPSNDESKITFVDRIVRGDDLDLSNGFVGGNSFDGDFENYGGPEDVENESDSAGGYCYFTESDSIFIYGADEIYYKFYDPVEDEFENSGTRRNPTYEGLDADTLDALADSEWNACTGEIPAPSNNENGYVIYVKIVIGDEYTYFTLGDYLLYVYEIDETNHTPLLII
nr:Ig-like domain-containing protein [Lachnospiraceae bacterium]